jgi:hypothetical protein
MMWRNFRKSLGFPTSNEVGALSSVIKELKKKTEESLGHSICAAAAAVPDFPAIYDEDLYDAFEYAGLNYLQIGWHAHYRTFLTYDSQAALARHNLSMCWDLSSPYACERDDLTETLDSYLLVTYTKSDFMISGLGAHAHDLYYLDRQTTLGLELGSGSSLRQTDAPVYWDKVGDMVMQTAKRTYTANKIIYVGDDAVDNEFYEFVNDRVKEDLQKKNVTTFMAITGDPVYVQAKGAAVLAQRRPFLPTPENPKIRTGKAKDVGEGVEL